MTTTTNTNRTLAASKELAKALIKIGKTDPLMREYLGEVLADAMRDFRAAEIEVDSALATL